MDISIFLAKVIGLYLIITAIAMFVNCSRLNLMLHESITTPGQVFIAGVLTLIIGILLIVSHNIWQADWRIVITIIGWLTFIGGIIRMFFPRCLFNKFKKINTNKVFNIMAVISLIVGLYLCYFGFIHA